MPFDDALDTLYEPNAVFSQFSGSDSMTFVSLFLSLFPLLVLPFLAFLVFSFSSFSFFVFLFCFLLFYFLSFLFLFVLCFFFPKNKIDLRLSCVYVVINTTCNIVYTW